MKFQAVTLKLHDKPVFVAKTIDCGPAEFLTKKAEAEANLEELLGHFKKLKDIVSVCEVRIRELENEVAILKGER